MLKPGRFLWLEPYEQIRGQVMPSGDEGVWVSRATSRLHPPGSSEIKFLTRKVSIKGI